MVVQAFGSSAACGRIGLQMLIETTERASDEVAGARIEEAPILDHFLIDSHFKRTLLTLPVIVPAESPITRAWTVYVLAVFAGTAICSSNENGPRSVPWFTT